MNAPHPQRKKLNIELGEKEAEGIYSNLALISHSPSEFIIDFARVLPGSPKSKIYARIVMTPHHAKLLSKVLKQNIEKFESQFGNIREIPSPHSGEKRAPGFVS
ncbi:MAG: hypothetical protein B6244_09740 [Candidatus Cloacimonetes bacterium 4572_55]|nr:MAG: hypothetical protein B6244_09740 [Candidatus Cloacimonetes bacterium 4572_55]